MRASLGTSSSNTKVSLSWLLSALKRCSGSRDIKQGEVLHARARESGHVSNTLVATALLHMYAKCGFMDQALAIFQKMLHNDVVSWTALMLGYAENGHGDMALDIFSAMQREGCQPNARTFVAAVLACSSLAEQQGDKKSISLQTVEKGRWIHEQAAKRGLDTDRFVGNSLVDMYAKFGSMSEAAKVFGRMPERDVVAWTALMLGYAAAGDGELVLELFVRMKSQGCVPDRLCFTGAVVACSIVAAKEEGKKIRAEGDREQDLVVKLESLKKLLDIHAQAVGFVKTFDVCLCNALVDAYSKCGSLLDARLVFDRMQRHDVVSFTSLMLGMVESDQPETALELLASMRSQACVPNARTFVTGLMACVRLAEKEGGSDGKLKLASLERGMEVHSQATGKRYDVTDMYVGNTLIDFYCKCGSLEDARRVFEKMAEHDLVSWNALIAGYLEHGLHEQALGLFCEMERRGCSPDTVSYTSALTACAGLSLHETGRQIHSRLCRDGLETDDFVHNSLVDFYGKSGRMIAAELVFVSLGKPDIVTWNALAAGFSREGSTGRVLDLFGEINKQGLEVDGITFLALLAAYGHAGLIDSGRRAFDAMVSSFRITPSIEHYHCLIDMLGRGNRLECALSVVAEMPYRPTSVTWTTVLSACAKWKNVEAGQRAFESLLAFDPAEPAAYVLMANVYGSAGMPAEEAEILSRIRGHLCGISL